MKHREAHSFGDRRGLAFALSVQHAYGHDARSVRQPGESEAVVGLLRDGPRDKRSVTVAVLGEVSARDEVIAADELVAREVRRAPKSAVVCVGDAGVEHRDHHPAPARSAVGGNIRPGLGRVDAERAGEVPLQRSPVPRGATGPRVVGERHVGDARAHIGDGPGDIAPTAQAAQCPSK